MFFKDYFSTQSIDYKKFRPEYPIDMIEFIISHCKRRETAWDCATGTGQVATMLVPYFNTIIATDASSNQISATEKKSNIEYRVANAEQSLLPENYFDLITVAQAIHWFNIPVFFKEARRVAKKKCVLAVWGYANHTIDKDIDTVVSKLYHEILANYWPAERSIVENGYRDIILPFTKINTPQFFIRKTVNLNELIGYLYTWSATQQYISKNHINPIELIFKELEHAWGEPSIIREIKWPVFLKISFID
jgi:hypothetical protein